ncbi:hypothetical protein [Nocardia sp. NPDC057668]|uniref:hypothetical protein n=1 Tax=Nocardia sp. NPDC057668 TaxID=3346202 RepID=UPI00366E7F88
MELVLPRPEELWSLIVSEGYAYLIRAGEPGVATKLAATDAPHPTAGDRLASEDGAGNWFVLVWVEAGRALLFGADESSELFETDFDPWGDAPEWVRAIDRPTTHPRLHPESDLVSFARWWDGASWCRTPFENHLDDELFADDPDADDGFYMGLRSVLDPAFRG